MILLNERQQLIWIKENELAGDSINDGIIRETVLKIYKDHLRKTQCTSAEGKSAFNFKASRC